MKRNPSQITENSQPKPWLLICRLALGIAILFFLGRLFFIHVHEIESIKWIFKPVDLILGTIIMFFSYFYIALIWHLLTRFLGEQIPFRESYNCWAYSQLARYVPGTVFVLLSRFLSYHERGSDKKKITVAFLLENVVMAFAAFIVFLALAWKIIPHEMAGIKYAALCIPLGFLFLHPGVFRPGFNFLLGLLHRGPMRDWPSYSAMIALVALGCLDFLQAGFGLFLFTRSFYPVAPASYLPMVGALAGAGVVNLIVFFVPAGIGVRDGALTYFLSSLFPVSISILIALTSRVWMTLIELLLPLAGWLWQRTHEKLKLRECSIFPDETMVDRWDRLAVNHAEAVVTDFGDLPGRKSRYIETISNLVIDSLIYDKKDLKILDFGCGAGRQAARLAEKGHSVTGIDISSELLKIAESRNVDSSVKFILFDGKHIPIKDDSKDIVITTEVLMYILDNSHLAFVLREFFRVLKPGGTIILIEHVKRSSKIGLKDKKIFRSAHDSDRELQHVGFLPINVCPIRKGRFLPVWFGFRWKLLPENLILPIARFELKIRKFLPMSLWDYYDVLYHYIKPV